MTPSLVHMKRITPLLFAVARARRGRLRQLEQLLVLVICQLRAGDDHGLDVDLGWHRRARSGKTVTIDMKNIQFSPKT